MRRQDIADTSIGQDIYAWRLLVDQARADGKNIPYNANHEFLLEHADLRHGRVKPRRGFKFGPIKQCYANSLRLANAKPELTYVEGMAYNGLIPMWHAWCLDPKGQVVDVTWRKAGPDTLYFGVPFDTDKVGEWTSRFGYYGIFENMWLGGVTFDELRAGIRKC